MNRTEPIQPSPRIHSGALAILALLGVALLWAEWPSLREMGERWAHDPRYAHGFLVPAFAAYLLWYRRGMLSGVVLRPSWWGLVLVAVGEAVKFAGSYIYLGWLEVVSVLPALAGLCLTVAGKGALRYAWPAIAFLVFMIPLPYRVEQACGSQLQRFATLASNYVLQTMGLPAVAEGNIILLGETRIGIVEACNGLGMLFSFIAIAVAVALLMRRGPVDRTLVVLSAVPIAMFANILRISATGLLHETAGSKVADVVYHDLAGWLMMPVALFALWAELGLMGRLFPEDLSETTSHFEFIRGAGGLPSDARSHPGAGRG